MGAIVPKQQVFMEMDLKDQQQVILELQGEVLHELIYKVHGRDGLSYAGVNHICFFMGDIKIEPGVQWERFEMHGRNLWSATVRAINETYNLASLGTAEVPELMEVYDRDSQGNKIPDGQGGFKKHLEPDYFCRRKALSMAQRNAKRAVIPEAVLKKWLRYFKDKKAGKQVDPPFKPKVVNADYQVLGEEPQEKKQPRRRERETLKKTEKAPVQTPPNANDYPRPPRSLDELHYRLGENVLDMDGTLVLSEYEDHYRVGKKRLLGDDEFAMISGWIRLLGGIWDKEGNCWRIPKHDSADPARSL